MKIISRLARFLLVSNSALFAAQPYPPKLEGARVETYKQVGDVTLTLNIFEPTAAVRPVDISPRRRPPCPDSTPPTTTSRSA